VKLDLALDFKDSPTFAFPFSKSRLDDRIEFSRTFFRIDIVNNVRKGYPKYTAAVGEMSHNARRLGEVADRVRHDLNYHK